MILLLSILFIFSCFFHVTNSFTVSTNIHLRHHWQQNESKSNNHQLLRSTNENVETWENLIKEKDNAVKKLILQEGTGSIPSQGSNIEISYIGKLAGSQKEWSIDDVIEAWLQNQQGLSDILEEPFRSNNIDGQILMDGSKFTEEFVTNELGISNKMQCKKTIMAAKRLWKQMEVFPQGFEFDSSLERGKNFSFILGQGKVIKGMDMAVSTMKVGEKARIFCRSDYGYGSEGYRTKKGNIVVPPFRSLIFDVQLISAST